MSLEASSFGNRLPDPNNMPPFEEFAHRYQNGQEVLKNRNIDTVQFDVAGLEALLRDMLPQAMEPDASISRSLGNYTVTLANSMESLSLTVHEEGTDEDDDVYFSFLRTGEKEAKLSTRYTPPHLQNQGIASMFLNIAEEFYRTRHFEKLYFTTHQLSVAYWTYSRGFVPTTSVDVANLQRIFNPQPGDMLDENLFVDIGDKDPRVRLEKNLTDQLERSTVVSGVGMARYLYHAALTPLGFLWSGQLPDKDSMPPFADVVGKYANGTEMLAAQQETPETFDIQEVQKLLDSALQKMLAGEVEVIEPNEEAQNRVEINFYSGSLHVGIKLNGRYAGNFTCIDTGMGEASMTHRQVRPDLRGQGLASAVYRVMEQLLAHHNFTCVLCHTKQLDVLYWLRKLEYEPENAFEAERLKRAFNPQANDRLDKLLYISFCGENSRITLRKELTDESPTSTVRTKRRWVRSILRYALGRFSPF